MVAVAGGYSELPSHCSGTSHANEVLLNGADSLSCWPLTLFLSSDTEPLTMRKVMSSSFISICRRSISRASASVCSASCFIFSSTSRCFFLLSSFMAPKVACSSTLRKSRSLSNSYRMRPSSQVVCTCSRAGRSPQVQKPGFGLPRLVTTFSKATQGSRCDTRNP